MQGPPVVQAASEITSRARAKAAALVKPGASGLAVCKEVDGFIASTRASSFNKQEQAAGRLDKGPAFPVHIRQQNDRLGFRSGGGKGAGARSARTGGALSAP